MKRIVRLISFLGCLLTILAIAGCYDAGYKRAEPLAATARLGELSDKFDADIASAIASQEDAALTGTTEDDTAVNGDESDTADEKTATPAVQDQQATPPPQEQSTAGEHDDATTPEITVTEGDQVRITVAGSDPDGDDVTYTYSSPLGQDGRWSTKRGDAGVYEAYVTATDEFGKSTTKSVVIVVLKANSPPTITVPDTIEVFEGETIELDLAVSDEDADDEVRTTITGWMSGTSRQTGFDDAGSHVVTITATDGKDTVSRDITVTVRNVNRAPEFEIVIG